MQTAFLIELGAVVLVMICCFVDPPLTSSVEGPVTYLNSAEIEVAGKSIEYLDQPVDPPDGVQVRVEYLDHLSERVVLSVTVAPGTPGSTTYMTHAGQRFHQWLWLSYLALIGLVAGLGVALVSAVRLYGMARQQGAPTDGLTAALAPFTMLGGVPLLANNFGLPGSQLVILACLAVWVLAAVGALFTRALPLRPGEVHVAVGRRGLVLVALISAIWILGWIGDFGWRLYQFETSKF
ncbi:MAG TPA: hypothetical protein VN906_11320 [Candidatus Sulfotelmatobacter sp.]|nr:hypothetical protein [Candidatus Sulfotelmatobacter sp.]